MQDRSPSTSSKPEPASYYLVPFFLGLVVLWGACFWYSRDAYWYVMSYVGMALLVLRRIGWNRNPWVLGLLVAPALVFWLFFLWIVATT